MNVQLRKDRHVLTSTIRNAGDAGEGCLCLLQTGYLISNPKKQEFRKARGWLPQWDDVAGSRSILPCSRKQGTRELPRPLISTASRSFLLCRSLAPMSLKLQNNKASAFKTSSLGKQSAMNKNKSRHHCFFHLSSFFKLSTCKFEHFPLTPTNHTLLFFPRITITSS
jgi:hypothetical protein